MSFAGLVSAQGEVTDDALVRAGGGRTVAVGELSSGGAITAVPLEIYVARVLAGEAEPKTPDAALEALAIAVRTYAVANAGRHRSDGFDLCDTTHCQVLGTPTPATRRAAYATAGEVLAYNGATAEVFYSASCGGRSEAASAVWPRANLPYLQSIEDDVHDNDPAWTVELPLEEIRRALARAGFEGERLRGIAVAARSVSGRVARLTLDGLNPGVIAGDAFRTAIGTRTLPSTAFRLSRHSSVVRFTGRGYGHGVGLCVIGAGRRARRGDDATAILRAYFPSLRRMRLGALAAGAM